MCLYAKKSSTERFRAKMKKNRGRIICWKSLNFNSSYKELTSKLYYKIWTNGWNKSDRKTKEWTDVGDYQGRSDTEINHGIHVYRSGIWKKYPYSVMVPVVCYEKDLVAADRNEAVFMKVYLRKKDYQKAISKNRKVKKI